MLRMLDFPCVFVPRLSWQTIGMHTQNLNDDANTALSAQKTPAKKTITTKASAGMAKVETTNMPEQEEAQVETGS